jgi:desulfoferrodoxin (superoxide reductase-like protein)
MLLSQCMSWQLTVKKTLYICLVHLIHWFDLLICKKFKKDDAHCYNCQNNYIYVWFSLFIDLISQSEINMHCKGNACTFTCAKSKGKIYCNVHRLFFFFLQIDKSNTIFYKVSIFWDLKSEWCTGTCTLKHKTWGQDPNKAFILYEV